MSISLVDSICQIILILDQGMNMYIQDVSIASVIHQQVSASHIHETVSFINLNLK